MSVLWEQRFNKRSEERYLTYLSCLRECRKKDGSTLCQLSFFLFLLSFYIVLPGKCLLRVTKGKASEGLLAAGSFCGRGAFPIICSHSGCLALSSLHGALPAMRRAPNCSVLFRSLGSLLTTGPPSHSTPSSLLGLSRQIFALLDA